MAPPTKEQTEARQRMESDREWLRQERARQESDRVEHEQKMRRGRPTPTQEEANQINQGLHPVLSPDGSEAEE
jgi:hypothetical protein